MAEILSVPQGNFLLDRYPVIKNETLRAWDAADEYLLQHISENGISAKKTLIINDAFGALSCALSGQSGVTCWSDSYLSFSATRLNLRENSRQEDVICYLPSTENPESSFELVIIKIPKSHALLEDYLIRLKEVLREDTVVIAAAMAKHIHTSTLNLFEKIIGDTTTSLARKKARLVFSKNNQPEQYKNPYPVSYKLERSDYKIVNHAAVFSREKLDIGTRLFIDHIPSNSCYQRIIDLGCGNGIVGMIAAEKNPTAEIMFTDESFMALESARGNMQVNKVDNKADYRATDCLEGFDAGSADLVLNNPPFHQSHSVGDATAWRMFRQSKTVLVPGGELWVIGNRHLGYHIKLKKLFGNCELVASNKKFVILKAVKSSF